MAKGRRPQPEPTEPIVGPTEEARARHEFERREVHKNDRKPYVRRAPDLVAMLRQRELITRQQEEALGAFVKDHRIIWADSGARDSCVQRIGGEVHETEAQAEAIVRAKQRTNRILNRCGPTAYAIAVQVAIYEQPLGDDRYGGKKLYAALRHAADAAAKVYGIPEYR